MQNLIIAGNVGLHELLRCDFDTGEIFWRVRTEDILMRAGFPRAVQTMATWNARYADKQGFTALDGHGYLMGRIFNRAYKAHRVVWGLKHGEWPKSQIDHMNGVRGDNRLSNLRSVDQTQNNRNRRSRSDNRSGHVGVCFDTNRQKWLATINAKHIGRFDDKEDAVIARQGHPEASGFTERHGI